MKYILAWWSVVSCLSQPIYSSTCDMSFLTIEFKDAKAEMKVELADSYLERKKGLMFRKKLDLNSGMLFIYEEPQQLGFWMKNTLVPLDIAFANKKGKVMRVVHDTEPLSLNIINSGENIQYVLEVNAGYSEQFNLYVGSQLIHSSIDKNLNYLCN